MSTFERTLNLALQGGGAARHVGRAAGGGAHRLRRDQRPQRRRVDALLASGCLSTVFRAPRIDGQTYRDGGYAANPAVFALPGSARTLDTPMVRLSPLEFAPVQSLDTAQGIQSRVAEIAFKAAFGARCRRSRASARRPRSVGGGRAANFGALGRRDSVDHAARFG